MSDTPDRRIVGFDVARAVALLGMVLVNYKGVTESDEAGADWLVWLSDLIDGRAATLFVLLAGIGVSLRSKRARRDPDKYLASERNHLLKRALMLLVVGLFFHEIWPSDILHLYGLFLALAAFVLAVPSRMLWLLALLAVVGAVVLQSTLNYDAEFEFWTFAGWASDFLFNGEHPLFPWIAILFVGMWLGRQELRDTAVREKVLVGALAVALVSEGIDAASDKVEELDDATATILSSWPDPPVPLFIVGATATAIVITCVALSLTEQRRKASWVRALAVTGQMTFTLYIAHAFVILPLDVMGLLDDCSLLDSMALSVGFFVAAVLFCVLLRRRYRYGPLEAAIRSLADRRWGRQASTSQPTGTDA